MLELKCVEFLLHDKKIVSTEASFKYYHYICFTHTIKYLSNDVSLISDLKNLKKIKT